MRSINPTPRDLRRINRYTVLQTLYVHASLSRLELSRYSSLSTGTVTNVVSELLAEGLVLEVGSEAAEVGRPRTLLALNTAYGYFFGVEIGEVRLQIDLFDLRLHMLETIRYELSPAENNPTFVVEYIAKQALALLQAANISSDKVLGMGLGVPGVVEHTGNETVAAPAWNWEPVPLKTLFRGYFSFPIHVENGSKTMALAEMYMDPALQGKTMAVLNLGTGVGAGIIYEGKLYSGATNSAGEWGHTIMALDGAPCRCGRNGCLEAYIGGPGIIRRLRELAPESPLLHETELHTIFALVEAAQRGEPTAVRVLYDFTHYLGAGLANLINLFNPQRIILGGYIGRAMGTFILPDLLAFVERYALQQPFQAMELTLSQPGRDDASVGAATLALDSFLAVSGNHSPITEALLHAREQRLEQKIGHTPS